MPPRYGHLPLLHGPDGTKLSKRHGAASVQELRDAGYLPSARPQLPRAARLGRRRRRDDPLDRGADRRFDIARRAAQPGAVRRAEAALAERPLHARAAARRADRGARGASTAATGSAPAAAISAEKLQTLADFWPLCGFIFDGPADDPEARERWLGRATGARCSRRRAHALGATSSRSNVDSDRGGADRRRRAPRRASRPRSTSRFGSRSPAGRSRPASSRRSLCSAATRRSRGSTRRSIPDRGSADRRM